MRSPKPYRIEGNEEHRNYVENDVREIAKRMIVTPEATTLKAKYFKVYDPITKRDYDVAISFKSDSTWFSLKQSPDAAILAAMRYILRFTRNDEHSN